MIGGANLAVWHLRRVRKLSAKAPTLIVPLSECFRPDAMATCQAAEHTPYERILLLWTVQDQLANMHQCSCLGTLVFAAINSL